MIRFAVENKKADSSVEAGGDESRLEIRKPDIWETTVLLKYRKMRA